MHPYCLDALGALLFSSSDNSFTGLFITFIRFPGILTYYSIAYYYVDLRRIVRSLLLLACVVRFLCFTFQIGWVEYRLISFTSTPECFWGFFTCVLLIELLIVYFSFESYSTFLPELLSVLLSELLSPDSSLPIWFPCLGSNTLNLGEEVYNCIQSQLYHQNQHFFKISYNILGMATDNNNWANRDYNEWRYIQYPGDVRPAIIATGVALLAGIFINYAVVAFVDIMSFCTGVKLDGSRKVRDHVSRHVSVFAIGCMLSMAPLPGLNGTFHAILAWLAWLCLMGMHAVHLWPFDDEIGRFKLIPTLCFYGISMIWYIGIVAYFFADTKGLR